MQGKYKQASRSNSFISKLLMILFRRPHELRCVKRAVLLETLADSLPAGTIKFNCKIIGVRQSHSRKLSAEAELEDGTIIRAKVCHI